MRKTLAEVTSDDALNPLIDLFDPPLRAYAQPGSSQQAKAERRQEAQREGLPHDARNLAGLVDVPSHDQDVAVFQTPAYRPNQRITTRRLTDSRYSRGLRRSINAEALWQLLEIASKPVASRIKQSRILDASRILAKMVRDCIGTAAIRQDSDEIELLGEHAIRSHDQIAINLPVDEAEHRDHEHGEYGGHRRGQRKVFERINWSWRIDPAGRCSDLIRLPDDGAGGTYCCARRMNPEPLTL